MGHTMPITTPKTKNSPSKNHSPKTIRDGMVGGVSAILLAFLPLSTVLGGGIAGYLQAKGTDGRSGQAGAIAGSLAVLPHLIVASYLIVAPDFVPPGPDVGLSPGALIAAVIGFGVIYAVGLGVLGGLLGGYIRREHVGN